MKKQYEKPVLSLIEIWKVDCATASGFTNSDKDWNSEKWDDILTGGGE